MNRPSGNVPVFPEPNFVIIFFTFIGLRASKPLAVGVLLSKPGDDRIVEACTQVVLLRYRVKLLAGEFEAIGDGFLLSRKVAPGAGAL